jgi:predicted phosphohydrolase
LDEEKNGPKLRAREAQRLEASLKAAGEREKIVFLHYPPLYQGYECPEILDLLERYEVKRCCFAHLHGHSIRLAIQGEYSGTDFSLVSADSVNFKPKKILD